MSALQHGFQRFLAIIGLVAVLLGALEHEDLILQVVDHAPAAKVASDFSFDRTVESPGSGTEGTFRSELHRLWLGPRHEVPWLPRVTDLSRSFSPRAGHTQAWVRRDLVAHVPLRV